MFQTQKLLLLRWQYTCQQLKGMSVQDTETPSTQMVIHLSTVVWDICSRYRNSLCLDRSETCKQLWRMYVPDTETPYTQMAIHLSIVVGDVCSRYRNSLFSDGNTPVNSCLGYLFQTQKLLMLR